MPRPDPFDFLARNGVSVQPKTPPTQGSPEGLDSTPKSGGRSNDATVSSPPGLNSPDGAPGEDLTQIAFFMIPEDVEREGVQQKVMGALKTLGDGEDRGKRKFQ